MLSLFKKRKNQPGYTESTEGTGEPKGISAAYIRQKRRWADFMQKKSERVTPNGKLILLALFCLGTGSLSIYLIASSLMSTSRDSIQVSPIRPPVYTGKAGDENIKGSFSISKQEYNRIELFRHYMDSLSRSPAGRQVYDSLLARRPGLMDSVAAIENLYQSQNK